MYYVLILFFFSFTLQLFRRVAAALPGMEQETKKPGESILLSNYSVTVLVLMPVFLKLLQWTTVNCSFFCLFLTITNSIFLLTSAIVLLPVITFSSFCISLCQWNTLKNKLLFKELTFRKWILIQKSELLSYFWSFSKVFFMNFDLSAAI